MFCVLKFAGHSAVALSGLTGKSCLLHFTGSSYPKKRIPLTDPDSPCSLMRDLVDRVLIPSIEDGNVLANDNNNWIGVSEQLAYDYWRYFKAETFLSDQKGWEQDGRLRAIDARYYNPGFLFGMNCAGFASRLLGAALLDLRHFGFKTDTYIFPSNFIDGARACRNLALKILLDKEKPAVYGQNIENLDKKDQIGCYTPADNWLGGHSESLPAEFTNVRHWVRRDADPQQNPFWVNADGTPALTIVELKRVEALADADREGRSEAKKTELRTGNEADLDRYLLHFSENSMRKVGKQIEEIKKQNRDLEKKRQADKEKRLNRGEPRLVRSSLKLQEYATLKAMFERGNLT